MRGALQGDGSDLGCFLKLGWKVRQEIWFLSICSENALVTHRCPVCMVLWTGQRCERGTGAGDYFCVGKREGDVYSCAEKRVLRFRYELLSYFALIFWDSIPYSIL